MAFRRQLGDEAARIGRVVLPDDRPIIGHDVRCPVMPACSHTFSRGHHILHTQLSVR